jgi:hypothetical protein
MAPCFVSVRCLGQALVVHPTGTTKAAGLGLSTIVDFERSRRVVPEPTVEAIHSALEKAGVEFLAEDDGGPGVRLRKAKRKGK